MAKHSRPQRIHGNARILVAVACVLAVMATAAVIWRPWDDSSPQVAPRSHRSTSTPRGATSAGPVSAPSALASPPGTDTRHGSSPAAANGVAGAGGAASTSGAGAPAEAGQRNARSRSTQATRRGTPSTASAPTHSRAPAPARSSRRVVPIGTPSVSLPAHL